MSKIVIVDDTISLVHKWKKAFSKENIEIIDAVNSHQLFDTLVKNEVNLIIIELFLGTEHGYYIIKRLREDPFYQKIPIMVVSTERRRASIQEVIDAGIVDYLIKPVDTALLINRAKRILHKEIANHDIKVS